MSHLDHLIIAFLRQAGRKGLKAKKLALHVYNQQRGLFGGLPFERVYQLVYAFLYYHARRRGGMVERVCWGHYRINDAAETWRQLSIDFKAAERAERRVHHDSAADNASDSAADNPVDNSADNPADDSADNSADKGKNKKAPPGWPSLF